jgi:hypothetical protein
VRASAGQRITPMTGFYVLPGDLPETENVLAHGQTPSSDPERNCHEDF